MIPDCFTLCCDLPGAVVVTVDNEPPGRTYCQGCAAVIVSHEIRRRHTIAVRPV